jgi:hypothetical protein
MATPEPPEYPDKYPGLPPFPAWLKFAICIGPDPEDKFPPPDLRAVGIYMGCPDDSCTGAPWLAKSKGGTSPWVSIRVAWEPEIVAYDHELLRRLGIRASEEDAFIPPYDDGVIPPTPPWMRNGLVTHIERNATDQTVIRLVGPNIGQDDELWVAASIGGYPFHSERIATAVDRLDYDAAFMADFKVTAKEPNL